MRSTAAGGPAQWRADWHVDLQAKLPANIEPLYTQADIARRVVSLGQQLTRDYRGKRLCVVGVLKGSFMFFADLVRQIDLPIMCEFIGTSSYGDDTKSSGVVKITCDLQHSIAGWDVLVVEDIVDTGLSMRYLLSNLATRGPRSLKVCTLLHKPGSAARRTCDVPIDYIGFTIPDAFVIGYGLDHAGAFRNLPFIGALQQKGATHGTA